MRKLAENAKLCKNFQTSCILDNVNYLEVTNNRFAGFNGFFRNENNED